MSSSAAAPTLSVVIPHHGDPTDTVALVLQLLTQRHRPPFEVIVVDDASPDPLVLDEPHVTVVRREVNGGFGSAVNTGVRQARAELVLVLNSDLQLPPDLLERLLARARPLMPAIVAPQLLEADGSLAPSARRFPTVTHQVVEWLTPLARFRDTALWHRGVGHHVLGPHTGDSVEVDWLVGACLLLPRAVFTSLGGFDEAFHMNSEEVDLQWRASRRGIPRLLLPDLLVTHLGGRSSDPQRRRRWLVDSRKRYADKWFPGGRTPLQLALTAATGANLGVNAVRRLRGRDVRPLATAAHELSLIWGEERR